MDTCLGPWPVIGKTKEFSTDFKRGLKSIKPPAKFGGGLKITGRLPIR